MKRTLAFIISVMMVLSLIPASLLTALANGTGTAGNYVENLSIDNAPFDDTEVPASIVADGKLDDTGWIRDQWNKVSSATGTWDVATPSHSGLVYEYQIQRDHQFLYGAYSFDMQTVESGNPQTVTLWLNDGTDGEAYWTQRIDITIKVNGDAYTAEMKRYYRGANGEDKLVDEDDVYAYSKSGDKVTNYKYFINDKDYYVLADAPACVAVCDTQTSVYDDNVILSDKVIVEFRTLLDVFSDQKQYDAWVAANGTTDANKVFVTDNNLSERDTITHITSASFGDGGALYYPRLNVGDDNREMVDPSVSWPADSIEISGSDIMNNDGTADYNNVLPSGIDVDGVFSEGVWSHISDFCQYGWAAGGMTDDYRAEGTYGGADLATFKNEFYSDSNWGASRQDISDNNSFVEATNTDAVRFKYNTGVDKNYFYGAMVIYSDEDAVTRWNKEKGTSYKNELTITLETWAENGDQRTVSIKLSDLNHDDADDNFLQNDITIVDGEEYFRFAKNKDDDGAFDGGVFLDHYFDEGYGTWDMKAGISAKRVSKYLVQVIFRFDLTTATGTPIFGSDYSASYIGDSNGNGRPSYRFTVTDGFGNGARSGVVGDTVARQWNDKFNWTYTDRVHASDLELSSGGLDQRSFPAMYAADNHVDYMVRSEASMLQAASGPDNNNDRLGTVENYTYKLLTDYDYLYGAAVVWDTAKWSDNTSATMSSGGIDCFRLWINSGTSLATGDVWDISISFFLQKDEKDGNKLKSHAYLQGKYTPYNGGTAYMLTMYDPDGIEVAINENPNGTEAACDGSGETYNEYLIEFKVPLSYLMKSIEDGAPSYSDSDVTVTETVDGVEYKTTYREAPVFNAIVSVGDFNNKVSGLFHSEIISGNNFRIYNTAGKLAYYSNFPIADINNVDVLSSEHTAYWFLKGLTGVTSDPTAQTHNAVYDTDFVGWPEDSDMTFTYDQRQNTGERLDYFDLDGRLEEFFWNNEAERVKVNGGNGYWAQVPATSEDFDYEYRIYTATENLYGAFKVNAAAVTKETKMAIWFNVDGRNGASHKLEFWMDENTSGEYEKNDNNYKVAWTLTGPDGVEIATSGTRLSDGGHEDYLRAVMKTINDETVLEFVMDLDIIDTAKDTVTNYNDYWKHFWHPVFENKTVSGITQTYTDKDGTKATGTVTVSYLNSVNGAAKYYGIPAGTDSNGNAIGVLTSSAVVAYYYKDVKVNGTTVRIHYSDKARTQPVSSLAEVNTTGHFWYGDEYTSGALPQYPNYAKDGFNYVVGVSQPVGNETLTLYHNGNGNKTFWVTGYNGTIENFTDTYAHGAGLIIPAITESKTVTVNDWASGFAFEHVGDGIYKVVDVSIDDAKNVGTGTLPTINVPAGGFAYIAHHCKDGGCTNDTYGYHSHGKTVADFTLGAYIQFSNLVIADNPQYSEFAYFDTVPNTVNKGSIIKVENGFQTLRGDSLGSSIDIYDAGYAPLADYRVISADEYTAKVNGTYLPATGGWSSRALEVAPLLDYKIEYITVDGDLSDNGWDKDGWIYVDSDVNSNLQTIVYDTPNSITDKDAEYTYKYQIRTDGEYIYVAAVLDVGMWTETGESDDAYAEPYFRVWFNSHPDRNKGDDGNDYNRLTFTQRYEIVAQKNGSTYNVGKPNFDARTYLNGWSAENLDMNKGADGVTYNGNGTISYSNVKLNVGGFSWKTEAGDIDYANPSGGTEPNPEVNGDNDNKTITNYQNYESSSFFGETIITEENTTSGYGSNDKDPTSPVDSHPHSPNGDFDDGWVAERALKKVTYGDQHATMVEKDGKTQVEFRIKIDEVADENGEFEYTVFAGLDYGQDLVMFYPMVDKEAGIYFPSGYDRFYNPNWFWPTNHFEWNAEVERDLMLRSPYEPVVNIGSQYFEAYPYTTPNSDGSYPSGLRLGGYYIQDYIHRQIRDDFGFSDYEEWDYWDVLEMGILYIPSQKFKIENGLKVLSPTEITPGATDAEADNILNWQEPNGLSTCFADYQSFVYYAVIVGIPQNQANLKYSYRCYMDYYGNDGLLNYEGSSEYPEYVDYYRETSSSNLVPSYGEDGKAEYDENGDLVMGTIDCKGTIYMETKIVDGQKVIVYRDANGNEVEKGVEGANPTPLYEDFYAPIITRSSTMAKSDLDATASYEETKGTNGYISGYTYTNTDAAWGSIKAASGALASATTHEMGDIGTFQWYFKNKKSDGDDTTSSAVAGATLGYLPYYAAYTSGTNAPARTDIEPANKERVEYLAAAAGYDLQTVGTWADVVNSSGITNWVICLNSIDETGWAEIQEFAVGKNVVLVYPWEWTLGIPQTLANNFTVVSGNDFGDGVLPSNSVGLLGVAAFTNKYVGNVNLHINSYGDELDAVEILANKIGATVNYNNTEAIEVLVLNSTDVNVVDNFISDLRNNLAESVPTLVINAVEGAKGHEFNDPAKSKLVDFDELLIEVPNIGRLLGYSSWKDAGTSAAIALSNAIARYSFLKNGGEEIDLDSHKGFVQSLVFSLVSDIAYEIDFLGVSAADIKAAGATAELDVAALCDKAFVTKADEIAEYINCSDMVSSITDTVRTDIFGGGKLTIGGLEYYTSKSQIALNQIDDGQALSGNYNHLLVKRPNFEIIFTDGINHAYGKSDNSGGEVYINTSLDTVLDAENPNMAVQWRDDTAVLRDSTDVGFSYNYQGGFGNLLPSDTTDKLLDVRLSGDLNDGYATPTIINKVLPDVITHEQWITDKKNPTTGTTVATNVNAINFELGVEANTWFAFVDDRMNYYNVWHYVLVNDTVNSTSNEWHQKAYDVVRYISNGGAAYTATYNGITYTIPTGDSLVWPSTKIGTNGIMSVSFTKTPNGYPKKAFIGSATAADDIKEQAISFLVGSNDGKYYPVMGNKLVSHAALYTSFWSQVDTDNNGSATAAELTAFGITPPSGFDSTDVFLAYENIGGHYYYVRDRKLINEQWVDQNTWTKIDFTFDGMYAQGYSMDKVSMTTANGLTQNLDSALSAAPKHEGFSNSTSYNDNNYTIDFANGNEITATWGQVGTQSGKVASYVYSQRGYGEIIIDLREVKSLSALKLHLGNAADAMAWAPTIEISTSAYTGDVAENEALPSMTWSDPKYVTVHFTQLDEYVYWTTASLEGSSARYIKLRFALNNGEVYYVDEVEVYGAPDQKTTTSDTNMLVAATYNVGQLREVFHKSAEYNFGQDYYTKYPTMHHSVGSSTTGDGYDPTNIGGAHWDNTTAGYVVKNGVITTAAEAMGDAIASLNADRKAKGTAEIGVIMLQEVQQYVQNYGAMDQLKLMAKAAGYDYFYYAAAGQIEYQADYYFEQQGIYDDPTTHMDNPSAGVAIMSKYPIVAARTFCQDSGEQAMAYAQINFNGKLVDVYSAHFAANGSDRAATHDNRMDQYALLNHVLKGRNEYSVVGGDFNERYLDTYADNVDGMDILLDEVKEEYVTIQDGSGNRKVIDNILVDSKPGSMKVEGIKVYNQDTDILCDNDDNTGNKEGYSDHYMALAALTVN